MTLYSDSDSLISFSKYNEKENVRYLKTDNALNAMQMKLINGNAS